MVSFLPSKSNVVAVFSILWCSLPFIGAWVLPSDHIRIAHHRISLNTGKNINANKCNPLIDDRSKELTATRLSLFKYKYKTDEITESESTIQLSSEQDQILRDSASSMEELYGLSWFEKEAPWDELKNKHSSLLQDFSNDELRRAYIVQSPRILDLVLKTPLGPFIALNLFFLLGGFSWCDTPFLGGSDTCLP